MQDGMVHGRVLEDCNCQVCGSLGNYDAVLAYE